jgi:hypothetical protein
MKLKEIMLPAGIGAIGCLANAWLFSNLWSADWRRPMVEWLMDRNFVATAGYLGDVWIRIPDFLTAVALGVVVAKLFVKRWAVASALAAVGFVAVSWLLMAIIGGRIYPGRVDILLRAEAWNVVSVALVFLGAWVSVRRNRRGEEVALSTLDTSS